MPLLHSRLSLSRGRHASLPTSPCLLPRRFSQAWRLSLLEASTSANRQLPDNAHHSQALRHNRSLSSAVAQFLRWVPGRLLSGHACVGLKCCDLTQRTHLARKTRESKVLLHSAACRVEHGNFPAHSNWNPVPAAYFC